MSGELDHLIFAHSRCSVVFNSSLHSSCAVVSLKASLSPSHGPEGRERI